MSHINVGVFVLSSRTCRSPQLHRNPRHISESELERPAWKERDSHRCLRPPQRHPTLKFDCVLMGVLCPQGIAFPGRNSTGQTLGSRTTYRTWRRSTESPAWPPSLPTPFRWPAWPLKVKVSCRHLPYRPVCHQVSFGFGCSKFESQIRLIECINNIQMGEYDRMRILRHNRVGRSTGC